MDNVQIPNDGTMLNEDLGTSPWPVLNALPLGSIIRVTTRGVEDGATFRKAGPTNVDWVVTESDFPNALPVGSTLNGDPETITAGGDTLVRLIKH